MTHSKALLFHVKNVRAFMRVQTDLIRIIDVVFLEDGTSTDTVTSVHVAFNFIIIKVGRQLSCVCIDLGIVPVYFDVFLNAR